jgi:hypothetical protein
VAGLVRDQIEHALDPPIVLTVLTLMDISER